MDLSGLAMVSLTEPDAWLSQLRSTTLEGVHTRCIEEVTDVDLSLTGPCQQNATCRTTEHNQGGNG
jgi:hypothetical protein